MVNSGKSNFMFVSLSMGLDMIFILKTLGKMVKNGTSEIVTKIKQDFNHRSSNSERQFYTFEDKNCELFEKLQNVHRLVIEIRLCFASILYDMKLHSIVKLSANVFR